ncbi:MAG: phosphoenolpyruvate--protein phosphotransferase [Candidatus Omnitrophica bacterium]|nr:phosphoenolpyruvate--protein phosphotransferase [Candidatus Omnitrophota bacterium]
MIKLKGIAVSSGVVIGKAFCIRKEEFVIPKVRINYDDISREIYRLEEALIDTRKEIVNIQEKISKELGFTEAKIFEAHLLVIEDRLLIEDVIKRIKNERVNVEFAFSESIKKYIDILLKLEDDYIRERVADIEDISKRVLRRLLHQSSSKYELKEKMIIVAHDLSPSETAYLSKSDILGFVTDIGGVTSHTAIIARSLSIPAVVGLEKATTYIKGGETIIVDATQGVVIVEPTPSSLRYYRKKTKELFKSTKLIHIPKSAKAITWDGREITVSANIEIPEELPLVEKFGAEGIGLYRTEYLFLGKKSLPSEEEQYRAYVNVARRVKPYEVIIRTIDIGGDKFLSRPEVPVEITPFLGSRAIRFCLAKPEIFKIQLRAILRASSERNVKLMFPMISGLEELLLTKKLIRECEEELRKEGKSFDEELSIGAMIEVPSAALIADTLAKESNFFSIGTNDLIQYSLAVDRGDEKVAYLYEPAHPGVLKLIKSVIDAGERNNIWVGMCGEMAGEPIFAFLLLGLGINELSMSPPLIPKIKELIRKVNFSYACEVAKEAINLPTPREIEKKLQEALKNVLKEDFTKIIGV